MVGQLTTTRDDVLLVEKGERTPKASRNKQKGLGIYLRPECDLPPTPSTLVHPAAHASRRSGSSFFVFIRNLADQRLGRQHE